MFKKKLTLTLLTFIGSHCCGAALPTVPVRVTVPFTVKNYSGIDVVVSLYPGQGNYNGVTILEQLINNGDEDLLYLPAGAYRLLIYKSENGEAALFYDDDADEEAEGYEGYAIEENVTASGAFTIYPDTISSSPPTSPVYSDPELSDSDTENT